MVSSSEKQTLQLGRSLAAQLRPGDVLLLSGELGAGKTVFARGVAEGLGVTEPVVSPTFTLLNCYQGRIPLHHFDLYRLRDADDFLGAGLDEYVGGDAVALIEWPERCCEALPACRLEIYISYGPTDRERHIQILPMGGFREVVMP